MASRLLRLQALKKSISNPIAITPITTISKTKYHGGRHFKRYNPSYPEGGIPSSPFALDPTYQRATGAPRSIPQHDPTRQIPERTAPYYQDFERQIEASKRREAIEASQEKPLQLLEKEQEQDDETKELIETKQETALIDRETDPFTNPSELFQEYGYSSNADLEYYSTPNTKVLEFHTAESVGKPFVETPDPVFIPDEHWVWEDPVELQQEAHIHEETVMDR